MKTEKFEVLTVGTYKLVDVEGYLAVNENNLAIYQEHFIDGKVDITEVHECGDGDVGYSGDCPQFVIDMECEAKFFERVVSGSEDAPKTAPTSKLVFTDDGIDLNQYTIKHATSWLVENRTSWSLAQEVLRLRKDVAYLQTELLKEK